MTKLAINYKNYTKSLTYSQRNDGREDENGGKWQKMGGKTAIKCNRNKWEEEAARGDYLNQY